MIEKEKNGMANCLICGKYEADELDLGLCLICNNHTCDKHGAMCCSLITDGVIQSLERMTGEAA